MRSWRIAVIGAGAAAVVAGAAVVAVAVLPSDPASPEPTSLLEGSLRVEVLETYPHDTDAFTQGLELHDGLLYEGTGLVGESDIRIVEYETATVQQQVDLPATVFGEGITIVDDVIWQLTWQDGFAFKRDRDTLAELEQVPYQGEGWGICYEPGNDRLVMSNGSDVLTFRDPETFDPLGTVSVTNDGEPVTQINELECVDGQVWANIWITDEIVRIDPDTGEVGAVVDASGLLSEPEGVGVDVLNGIAAVPDSDTFLITGKLWPKLFLVKFVPA